MELWRTSEGGGERPQVLGARTLSVALALHVGFFLIFWIYAVCHDLFHKDEEIIPIDLTVVVNENLDGEENEPPPLQKPEPPPLKPKPKPKPKPKEPEKPKELEKVVTNVVTKVEKAEKKPEPPPEEKAKPEEKKPEPPKKTAKELREERIRKMRESAKTVKKSVVKIEVKNVPSGNGRTARKTLSDAEIQRLLNMGYRPGTSEQLATSELQLGYSLIKRAFEAKWDKPPWTDTLRPMTIRVWFGPGGRVNRYQLEKSSGDVKADQSIRSAASRVGSIPALPAAFIKEYGSRGVPIEFTVKPH